MEEIGGVAAPVGRARPEPPSRDYRSPSTRATTPARGSVPKCLDPGAPKVRVISEYFTSVPPVTSICSGVREMGAAPPSVIIAVNNLWQIDLDSGAERQLTEVSPHSNVRDFDISPHGSEVVLELMQEHSSWCSSIWRDDDGMRREERQREFS